MERLVSNTCLFEVIRLHNLWASERNKIVEYDHYSDIVWLSHFDVEWTIVEPKPLKQMTIVEALKYYIKENVKYEDLKSAIAGNVFCTLCEEDEDILITPEEIDGMWTIEGIYED